MIHGPSPDDRVQFVYQRLLRDARVAFDDFPDLVEKRLNTLLCRLPGGIATDDAAFPDQTAVWLGIETVARGLGPTPGRTSSIASMPVAVTAPVARNIEA